MGFIEGLPVPKRVPGLPFFISKFEFSWYCVGRQQATLKWKSIVSSFSGVWP